MYVSQFEQCSADDKAEIIRSVIKKNPTTKFNDGFADNAPNVGYFIGSYAKKATQMLRGNDRVQSRLVWESVTNGYDELPAGFRRNNCRDISRLTMLMFDDELRNAFIVHNVRGKA